MKPRAIVVILIGLPGAGKTYFASNFKIFLENMSESVWHIEYDAELLELSTDSILWRSWRRDIISWVDSVLSYWLNNSSIMPGRMPNCEVKPSVILVDDNMYYPSMRYSWYKLARKHELSFCQIFIDCSLALALHRNSLRNGKRFVSPEIIKRMSEKISEPNPSRNLWEKFFIRCNSDMLDADCFKAAYDIIAASRECPVYPITNDAFSAEVERQANLNSVLHQCDICLRRIVNRLAKCTKEQDLLTKCSKAKSELLANIGNGVVVSDYIFSHISSGNIDYVRNELFEFLCTELCTVSGLPFELFASIREV